jgi:hypothetical protein
MGLEQLFVHTNPVELLVLIQERSSAGLFFLSDLKHKKSCHEVLPIGT